MGEGGPSRREPGNGGNVWGRKASACRAAFQERKSLDTSWLLLGWWRTWAGGVVVGLVTACAGNPRSEASCRPRPSRPGWLARRFARRMPFVQVRVHASGGFVGGNRMILDEPRVRERGLSNETPGVGVTYLPDDYLRPQGAPHGDIHVPDASRGPTGRTRGLPQVRHGPGARRTNGPRLAARVDVSHAPGGHPL